MPQRKADKDIANTNPLESPEGVDITQQSGYAPVREEPSPYTDANDATQAGKKAVSSTAARTKRQASEAADQAGEQIEHAKGRAADAIDSGAGALRDQPEVNIGAVDNARMKVADSMESTASYLRDRDSSGILNDAEQYLRDHPMQAIAGAVAAGFVLGWILT
jgi:ElaB/YqjD/DUF883 family membrane-anchored ribosome-binding protein